MTVSDPPPVWSAVKATFPYTDCPALVVVQTGAQTGLPLLWGLIITSAENRGRPGDVAVSDRAAAGLPAPSIVRPGKIATIDARDAEMLGALPEGGRAAVSTALRRWLGLGVAPPA